jgi:hypothetical protein
MSVALCLADSLLGPAALGIMGSCVPCVEWAVLRDDVQLQP